jgi:uncharacterized protein
MTQPFNQGQWSRSVVIGFSCLLGSMLIACGSPTAKPSASQPNDNVTLAAQALPLPQQLPFTQTATIRDKTFKIAVAETEQQQQTGLMYRPNLPDDEGMVFTFQPARPVAFWMKNTLIALDMLYMKDGVIQEIQANVPPCKADPCPSYPSKGLIDQVIEIRGGLAAELGIQAGDRVTFTKVKN